jgi:cytochrome o ubiquinol oxidase operon protein cyoD
MNKGTAITYTLGFIISIGLTVIAFELVSKHYLAGSDLIIALLGLALIQLVVQLLYFLHMSEEPRPRWNFVVFISTVSVVFILVAGSIWIMRNLNYRHSIPTDVEIMQDEGIHR